MKRNLLYLTLCLTGLFYVISCTSDDPDQDNSIFDKQVERNSFDHWLDSNYVRPYNILVAYRLMDVQTDFSYNVIPADIKKSKQMAIVIKHLWLDAYAEVAKDGIHFIRGTAPRLFHFIGSAEYDVEAGSIRLGVAEGGKKITIAQINELNPRDVINQKFFNTLHHEFAHILHQTKNYPTDFRMISAADYTPATWHHRSDEEAARLGFVSRYAGAQHDEDFVEVLARYLTRNEKDWNATLGLAGEGGRIKILQKLEIVTAYMKTSWGIDLDELKTVVHRRANETRYMELDDIDF